MMLVDGENSVFMYLSVGLSVCVLVCVSGSRLSMLFLVVCVVIVFNCFICVVFVVMSSLLVCWCGI